MANKYPKTLSLRKVGGKLYIYSNYTGAIEPLTIKGLITQLKDFKLPLLEN